MLACATNCVVLAMWFGQSLSGSLLAREVGASAAWQGLIVENGEPLRTPSTYATDNMEWEGGRS